MIPSFEKFWFQHQVGMARLGWFFILYAVGRSLAACVVS